jgi:hypothetical protein
VYFLPLKRIPLNTTNNTKQHQQHQNTLKTEEKENLVAFSGVSCITPDKKQADFDISNELDEVFKDG